MEFRCVNCGIVLAGAPLPGQTQNCVYCGAPQPAPGAPLPGPAGLAPSPYGAPPAAFGAPQNPYVGAQNPYGPGPSPYGASPPGVIQLQGPGAGGARVNPVTVVVALAIFITFAGVMTAFIAMHPRTTAGGGLGLGGGFATKSLATLSLAQTPDAMAKAMGSAATPFGSDSFSLMANLSGGPYKRVNFTWDKADPSHVKMVYFYSDSPRPDIAAVHAKLAALLGPRLDAKGTLNYHGMNFDVDTDTAHVESDLTYITDKNPYWKQEVDAGWDVLRSVVLGLPVTVTTADTRDWLARGYTMQALGAIDTTVDVDHSTAMMQAAFANVATRTIGSLNHEIPIDNPWFSQAELNWPNKAGGLLEEVILRPPPYPATVFPDQNALEACLQNIIGGNPERRETDHLKGTHSTDFKVPDGGSVQVDDNVVFVRMGNSSAKKGMNRADFLRVVGGMGACAPKK